MLSFILLQNGIPISVSWLHFSFFMYKSNIQRIRKVILHFWPVIGNQRRQIEMWNLNQVKEKFSDAYLMQFHATFICCLHTSKRYSSSFHTRETHKEAWCIRVSNVCDSLLKIIIVDDLLYCTLAVMHNFISKRLRAIDLGIGVAWCGRGLIRWCTVRGVMLSPAWANSCASYLEGFNFI